MCVCVCRNNLTFVCAYYKVCDLVCGITQKKVIILQFWGLHLRWELKVKAIQDLLLLFEKKNDQNTLNFFIILQNLVTKEFTITSDLS